MSNTIVCVVENCKHNKDGYCVRSVVHIKFYKHIECGPRCYDYVRKEHENIPQRT